MKFIAVTFASLVALAAAERGCRPGTYSCTTNPKTGCPGWQTCDITRRWVYSGDCPPDTVCKFHQQNGSPYCVPPDFVIP
ncbi:hypothetical protein DL766_006845 [Monosporascus sp. MC13-8B]|uniref:CBM1 domain-containing protein n=1 Tax=Monosporascus cannonballus TaxID=155416 RepID=A0ABY0HNL0_9PEZI|nr:hypothetical protein DL763_007466 [Monosporascus cannonballus]RYO95341.1 hypothetical protein DL762_000083 [Monosporascus cannonballus]RYP26021.1 hypothetical protein DL766_006845 [Monosporascus sp. MC13-8B]